MHEDIPPLPNTPSQHGDQLKKSTGQLYFYLTCNSSNTNIYRSPVEVLHTATRKPCLFEGKLIELGLNLIYGLFFFL